MLKIHQECWAGVAILNMVARELHVKKDLKAVRSGPCEYLGRKTFQAKGIVIEKVSTWDVPGMF